MILATERLRLRCLEPEDAAAALDALNDWAVAQWLSTPPFPYAAADFATYAGRMRRDHEGGRPLIFAMAEAAQDMLIGVIGIDRHGGGEGELGYWLARDHWGRGYAVEAGTALLAHAAGDPALKRLISFTDPENARSHRVLLKLGFAETGSIIPPPRPSKRGATFLRSYQFRGAAPS